MSSNTREKFRRKEYRDAFIEAFVDTLIATQIKTLREKRELTQAKLAELIDTGQSRISAIENVNYSNWSVNTLRKVARAFDVALIVKFASFGEALKESDSLASRLVVPSFGDDAELQHPEGRAAHGEAVGISQPVGSSSTRLLVQPDTRLSTTASTLSYSEADTAVPIGL